MPHLRSVGFSGGAVPLARRNVLADRRRLAVTASGVGLAVMLILLLDGLWAGIRTGVTAYEDNVGADLYVAQTGTRNFYGSSSRLPLAAVGTVERTPSVDWAAPVRSFYAVVQLHDRKVPVSVIGSRPDDRGGAWRLWSGRVPRTGDEVVVGRVLAERHGVQVGDRVSIVGRSFRVVGTGSDAFMASFVFMTHAATDALLAAPASTSFVLVGTSEPAAVRARLEARGLAVLTRDELGRNDFELLARALRTPMQVMTGVAFAVGSIVIALATYTAVVERQREYGIVKAMGAGGRYLSLVAVRQACFIAATGIAAGAVLFVVGRWSITELRPQFLITLSLGNVVRAVGAALLMALLGAVVPALRLVALEPATAYRGA